MFARWSRDELRLAKYAALLYWSFDRTCVWSWRVVRTSMRAMDLLSPLDPPRAASRARARPRRPQAHVRAQTSSSLATLLGEQGRTDLFYASRGMLSRKPSRIPTQPKPAPGNLSFPRCRAVIRNAATPSPPNPTNSLAPYNENFALLQCSISAQEPWVKSTKALKARPGRFLGPTPPGLGSLCSQLRQQTLQSRSANANGGGKAIAPFALICPGAERFVVGWCGVLGSWVGGGST